MRRSLLHRLTGLLLLMAHAITGTSVLPAFTALAADIEGSHAVMVSQGQHGTQIVLHHRPNECTPEVEDHANALARMVVRLCKNTEEGDHRLASGALSSGLAEEKQKQARAKKQAQPALFAPHRSPAHQASLWVARGIRHDLQRSDSVRLHSIHVMLASVRLMV